MYMHVAYYYNISVSHGGCGQALTNSEGIYIKFEAINPCSVERVDNHGGVQVFISRM